ncbi:MAG: precorrin-6Y C5,15-methyltransferase (decarboxylating) subunit CbiT [Lachnospiraceae bacterium]|nr:precorrin-6Y C5,15-methyltransferase (decarboxylating) subunit CbiT [Lachnospiraceae bacterium]
MNDILIFGGTIEGRQVSEYLVGRHIRHTVCVATEYGEEVLQTDADSAWRTIHQGRMDMEEMRKFLRDNPFVLVVDATHPYAVEVSNNIREACEKEQVPYVRYLRPEGEGAAADDCAAEVMDGIENDHAAGSDDKKNIRTIYVNSAAEAAEYLEKQKGGIFLTTGSKELHVFTERISDKKRLFVRVLPSAEVIASCRSLGLEGKQICAMQGPFSAEINTAMLRQTHASFLVTKDTGISGGFPEKMEAVRECRITAVIIRRPQESGAGWEEVRARIEEALAETDEVPAEPAVIAANPARRISCIGIGMGTPDTMTREAAREIREAEVIFGAKRMLECAQTLLDSFLTEQTETVRISQSRTVGPNIKTQQMVAEYSASKIYAWLEAHPQVRRAAILMSGDVGFYSGARQIAETFPAGEVRYYCGISSVVYFASRIPTSWQDAKLLSAHGKELALVNYVKKYPKIILLVSGEKDISRLCRQLVDGKMGDVKVTIGANLSYPDERVETGAPGDFLDYVSDVEQHRKETEKTLQSVPGLYVMMVENAKGGQIITPGIPDKEFVRGEVPMTKEEIRALSIAKLRLKEDSVVYDIGAGTGSVSIECALLCTAGQVYAIERNTNGTDLIQRNSYEFGVANLSIIEGTAPEALLELPAPTHAFIGGSSGNMREIIDVLLQKNPSVRIVINTVTLESIAEVMVLIRELQLADADVVQISAAKSRTLGNYHLMTAHNPVYIVSFGGDT